MNSTLAEKDPKDSPHPVIATFSLLGLSLLAVHMGRWACIITNHGSYLIPQSYYWFLSSCLLGILFVSLYFISRRILLVLSLLLISFAFIAPFLNIWQNMPSEAIPAILAIILINVIIDMLYAFLPAVGLIVLYFLWLKRFHKSN